MTPREQLIEALKRLCQDNGGHIPVADKAGVNDQSIYQIITGVRLPSGEPKAPGNRIQKALSSAFPGWERLADGSQDVPRPAPAWPFQEVEFSRWNRLSGLHKAWVEKAMLDEIERIEARANLKTGTGS